MNKIKRDTLAKNYIFQVIYQAIMFVIPLVISPYLTRTLGDTELGNYTYINSIAYYFVVFANLGIAKYGQRVIARSANNESALRKAFWSLYFVHCCFSVLSFLLYFSFCITFADPKLQTIYLVELLFVASAIFDVTWLFYGLENFRSVVLKNGVIKVIECLLIFSLIKNSNDLITYTFIVAGGIIVGQIVLFFSAIRIVRPTRFSKDDVVPHIKPLLIFTVAIVATTMYTVFDKTLLGIFFEKKNVAYYEYANKIISIPRTFISVTGTIVYPRACMAIEQNCIEEQNKYLKASTIVASFIGFGSLFGLLAISKEFAVLYFGEAFFESGNIMKYLCVIPLVTGLCDIFRAQYLLPLGRDKEYTLCIIGNAVINLAVSFILIHFIGVYGVVVGTIVSEVFGLLIQGFLCKKYLSFRTMLFEMFPFLIIGIIMYFALFLLKILVVNSEAFVLLSIAIGAVLYIAVSALYLFTFKREFVKDILTSVKRKKKETNFS